MLAHDLRFGVRALVRRPGFALLAVLLLALGAGANAAVFSVVRAVLWRPLPFAYPERLVAVWPDTFVSMEEVGFWRDRAPSLDAVASLAPGWLMALAAEGGPPVDVTAARVSDNLFPLLGVRAALGRTLLEGESTPGRDRVAVLSDGLWRQRFGGETSVIGRVITVDQVPLTVVGVMPAGFEVFGREADLWVPLVFAADAPTQKSTFSLAVGRLRSDASIESASRELAALAPEMRAALGRPDDWGRTIRVGALHESVVAGVRPALRLLFGAVGFILLLGAVNLGTLVLGRSIGRARELAVRAAVGAARWQLVRQLLIEQALLATAGSLAGLALAWAGLPILVARIPPEVPRQAEIALDVVVFVTVLAASVGLAVVMALVPALIAMRPGVQPLLRQHGGGDNPARQRALGGMVAAQLALAIVVGAGAGLMLRSLWQLQHVHPGFDPNGVLTFRLQTTSTYRSLPVGLPYIHRIADRVRALPGVTAVGAIGHLPMSGYSWTIPVFPADRPPAAGASPPQVAWRFIWGDYFTAMRIPLIAGRQFGENDSAAAPLVAIVNETMARQLFGSAQAALGQRVVQRGGGRAGDFPLEIVGIVGDVHHEGLDAAPRPEFYRPLQQTFMFPVQMVARTTADPAALATAVRQAAYEVDATVPVANLQPLSSLLVSSLARPRLLAFLLSVFAAIGVLLGIVGLYGVIAVRVRQQEREIGIRLALGASPRRMALGVIRQGTGYAIAGLALGVPSALALARLMESVVFGITTHDPITFALLPAVLAVVTILACSVPARRAARVDPVTVIRGSD